MNTFTVWIKTFFQGQQISKHSLSCSTDKLFAYQNPCIISYCFSLLRVTAAAALQLLCYQGRGELFCDDCAKQSTSEQPILTRKPKTPFSSWTASASWIQQVVTSVLQSKYVLPSWHFPCFHGTFGNNTSYQNFSSHQLLLLSFSHRNSILMVTVLIKAFQPF